MKSYKTPPILCGTDFSANAAQAATAAAALAGRMGRPLLLMHAADEFNAHGESKQSLARFLRPVRQRLRAEAERLRGAGAEVEVELRHGSGAVRAIADLAEQRFSPLVVVSAVSKTAFDRWTLGSVSESLAEAAAVPTLIVREAAPFEAWGRGERPLRVLVAVDRTNVSEAPLRWVRELLLSGPCEVTVAYVSRLVEERKRLGLDSMARTETMRDERQLLERELRGKIRGQFGREPDRIVVEPIMSDPAARFISLAAEVQADVMVVGTRPRRGLDRLWDLSVSRAIVRHAPMNVVGVPASAVATEELRIPGIERVLVATDFSALADRAVLHAYSLVREGGTVLLVHVAHPMRWPSVLGSNVEAKAGAARATHAATLAAATTRLRTLIPEDGGSRGIASEVHVAESSHPARAIVQAAERFGADVICLGTHGRSGLSASLVGSVTHAVLQQTFRPVFLVRPPAE